MRVGTTGVLDVATGGDPLRALLAAARALTGGETQLVTLGIGHDDGCPCVEACLPMPACTCEVVRLEARRIA